MKKLLLIPILSASLFAFNECEYAVQNANKYIKAFTISARDGVAVGIRADYNYFMYYAKEVETKCTGKNVELIKKARFRIMEAKREWDNQ